MRRSLAILGTFAIVLSFFPLLPFVPAQVAQGATTNLTCTGTNDQVAIQAAINAAAAGDTINIAGGVCDIQFTLLVNKPLTLQGQGKDVTYLKGSQVAGLQTGERVEVTGRRNGSALFASAVRSLGAAPGHGANAKARAC